MKIFCSPDSMKYYKSILLASALVLSVSQSTAQTISPYSRYGIGDAVSTANIFHLGMAGTSVAAESPYILNYNNPASYSAIGLSTFQLAVRGNKSRLTNSTTLNLPTGSQDIHYLNLGLPLKKNTGLSFGLMPISKVYYRLTNEFVLFDTTKVINASGGTGNFQNIYAGVGHKHKNISVGANVFYTFGSKSIQTLNNFADSLAILTAKYQRNLTGGGIGASFGLQYGKEFKNNRSIRIGATYNPAYTLRTKTDVNYISNWQQDDVDTASSITEQPGKTKMPTSYAIGISGKINEKVTIAAEYNAAQWSQYTENGATDSLTDNSKIAIGMNYVPDANAVLNYWKHVEYRIGMYTGNEFVKLRNTTMPVRAVTAGISFPFRRTRDALGFLHTAFEVGSRGTVSNNLVKDNFTRFSVGLTLNAKWFTPTKYD
jgi:hypothetical protein